MMANRTLSLPTFSAGQVALDYRGLRYNPCDDLIFPSIIKVADCLPGALDAYYLYYAPHNNPGGICLATAPSLEGPWTEYGANPLITRDWAPHYRVAHVSSPHVIRVEEAGKFFLFYHGDNDTTRYASSLDGIRFDYEGIAVSARDCAGSEATFYARAFRHPITESENGYVLLFVDYSADRQGLRVGRSRDARNWRFDEEMLLTAPAVEGARYIWSPCLFRYHERLLLAYHVDFFPADKTDGLPLTDIYVSEVNEALTTCGTPTLLCPRQQFDAQNERLSDPCLLGEQDRLYLFATVGPRLDQRIAVFTAA